MPSAIAAEIPGVVLRDGRLSDGAKLAYGLMFRHRSSEPKQEFDISVEEMAVSLKKPVKTVERYFSELKRFAYIATVRLNGPRGPATRKILNNAIAERWFACQVCGEKWMVHDVEA